MPVMKFMLPSTSPTISVRSDSRQNETCPGEWPGVSSTVKPATSSPSPSARATGWGGPVQKRPCTAFSQRGALGFLIAPGVSIAGMSPCPHHKGMFSRSQIAWLEP